MTSEFDLHELSDLKNKSKSIGDFISSAVDVLHKEGKLPSASADASNLLKVAIALNERNTKLLNDKERECIEKLLTPFILKADEIIEFDEAQRGVPFEP